jgi:hypothetical protein
MSTLFISMIGLEERVLGFLQMPNRPLINKYLLLINKEFESDPRVIEYKSKIENMLKGDDFEILTVSYFNSLELVKQINQYLSKNKIDINSIDIHLDMSTFNRQNLLTILFLLRQKYGQKKLTCYYTIPADTNENISKFAHNAHTIPFLGGEQSLDKNKLLILLAGYEYDRAYYLYEKIEPSKTIIAV